MKLKKSAQVEMIGLVIIVFLLAIGMFFMVSMSNKDNSDMQSINPQNVELSQNMIDAIKYIKLDCPGIYGKKVGIDDLVRDMATDQRIVCSGKTSEEFTKLAISNILNATLGNWSKAYSFVIIKNEGRDDEKSFVALQSYGCTFLSEGKPGEQPFPLSRGAGTVTMKLHICK